jgi:fatty acid desaturase
MSETAPALRIADADRERVAERLRRAAGEGRLAPEELEERLEAAFSARTEAELAPLVADLPSERPVRPPRRRRYLRPFVATSILLVAIWALTGAGYFWPIWPLVGWGFFVLGPRKALGFRACHPSVSSRR